MTPLLLGEPFKPGNESKWGLTDKGLPYFLRRGARKGKYLRLLLTTNTCASLTGETAG